jgi:hypothetical protein
MSRDRARWRGIVAGCCIVSCCLTAPGHQASAQILGAGGVLLLGTGNSGLYRSSDGGATWQPSDAGLPIGGVWQVLSDPAHVNVAYVTTGSVFRTGDAGVHWRQITGLPSNGAGVTALSIRSNLLLAAGSAAIVDGNGRGVVASSLSAVPGGAPRQIVAVGDRLVYAVGADGTLYLHGDLPWLQGASWQPLRGGLPTGPISAFTYVPDTARAETMCPMLEGCVVLYAGVTGHGLWQSLDSGRSWSQETAERDALPTNATIDALLTTDLRTTYAAVDGLGLYRSRQSGQFWKPARAGPPVTFTALAQFGATIVAASRGYGIQLFDASATAFSWRQAAVGIPQGAVGISLANVATTIAPIARLATLPGSCTTVVRMQLCGPFRDFYTANRPPLLLFGNPITPAEYATSDPRLIVQYFDRARFEYRPGTATGVRLTPLGRLLTATRHFAKVPPAAGDMYIARTGFSIGGVFLAFWKKHGGAQTLGYPISPVLREPNGDGTNRAYILQYFENARLEVHPEQSNTPFSIELGLLGRQYLCLHVGTDCRN